MREPRFETLYDSLTRIAPPRALSIVSNDLYFVIEEDHLRLVGIQG